MNILSFASIRIGIAQLKPLTSLARSESGVSAVEFALIAPVLVAALVGMVDVGMALTDRMALDHVVRAGAHVAMTDPGLVEVQQVLDALAQGKGMVVEAKPYCACSAGGACSEPCADAALYTAYHLTAASTYQSMISPFTIDMDTSVEVQVK